MSRLRDERGSVSILVAAMAGVVVVLALAAAQELALPGGVISPSEIAASYAARNGAVLGVCACEPGSFAADVEVAVGTGALFLAPDDLEVVASAPAGLHRPA